MLFSMNQKKEILDPIQRFGNLNKLRQKIVTGQPGISFQDVILIKWQTKLTMLGKAVINRH